MVEQVNYDDTVASHIDMATLEKATDWLTEFRRYLSEGTFVDEWASISRLMGSSAASSPFGGQKVEVAGELWNKHHQFLQAAIDSYKEIARQLKDAADGTRRVIENYQAVEQRNAANAQEIERALSDPNDKGNSTKDTTGGGY